MNITDQPKPPRTITVLLEPEGKSLVLPWPKTVAQLLRKLNLACDAALVIRDNGLLTHDRRLYPGDHITVRIVTSRG